MLVGSSQRSSSGPRMRALAMATRWRCPPERESLTLEERMSSSPRPSSSRSSRARFSASFLVSRPRTMSHGSRTASRTVRVGGRDP